MYEIGRMKRLDRQPLPRNPPGFRDRFSVLLQSVVEMAHRRLIAAVLGLICLASGSLADSVTPYLSARIALAEKDYAQAEESIREALEAEPNAVALLRFAFHIAIESGNRQQTLDYAKRLRALDDSSQLLSLIELVEDLERARYRSIARQARDGNIPVPTISDLAAAWADFGRGNVDEALFAFEKAAATGASYKIALMQLSLILALEGDFQGADSAMNIAYSDAEEVPPEVRLAWAQIRDQIDEHDGALDLLEDMSTANDDIRNRSEMLRDSIVGGEPVAFDVVSSAQEGLGQFLSLAASDPDIVQSPEKQLLYARLAVAVKPNDSVALSLIESLTEQVEGRFLGRTMAQPPEALPEFIAATISAEVTSPQVRLITLQTQVAKGELDAAHEMAVQLYEEGYEDDTILIAILVGDIAKGQHDRISAIRGRAASSMPGPR